MLDGEERERAARFRLALHRRRFVAARGALRRILGGYLGMPPAELHFTYGPHGKPALPAHPELSFNLSHSEDLALLAVTCGPPVGVDVERLRRLDNLEGLARRVLSGRERRRLAALPPEQRQAAFHRAWTRKEAYLKARGEGIFRGLERVEVTFEPGAPPRLVAAADDPLTTAFWTLCSLEPAPGFIAAVAVAGPVGEPEGWREPER